MLAHESNLAELDQNGIPMSIATDPRNAFHWVSSVATNFASETLAADQKAYYDLWDKDPKKPINRAGHMWSVRLRNE